MATKKIDVLLAEIGVSFNAESASDAAAGIDNIAKSVAKLRALMADDRLKQLNSLVLSLQSLGKINLSNLGLPNLNSLLNQIKDGYLGVAEAMDATGKAAEELKKKLDIKEIATKEAATTTTKAANEEVNARRRETQAVKQETDQMTALRKEIRQVITLRAIAASNRAALTPNQNKEISDLPAEQRAEARKSALDKKRQQETESLMAVVKKFDAKTGAEYDQFLRNLEVPTRRLSEALDVAAQKAGLTRKELELLIQDVSKDLTKGLNKDSNIFKQTNTKVESIESATKALFRNLPKEQDPPEVQSLNAVKQVLEEIRALMLVLARDVVTSWSSVEGGLSKANAGLLKTMLEPYEKAYDILVGHSIVPDMVDRIKELLAQALPNELSSQAGNILESIIEPYIKGEKVVDETLSHITGGVYNLIDEVAKVYQNDLFKGTKEEARNIYLELEDLLVQLIARVNGQLYNASRAYKKYFDPANVTIPESFTPTYPDRPRLPAPGLPAPGLPAPEPTPVPVSEPPLTESGDKIVDVGPGEVNDLSNYNAQLSYFQENIRQIAQAVKLTPKVVDVLRDTVEIPAANFNITEKIFSMVSEGIDKATQSTRQMSAEVAKVTEEAEKADAAFREATRPVEAASNLIKGLGSTVANTFKGIFNGLYGGTNAPLEQLTTTSEGAAAKLALVEEQLQKVRDSLESIQDLNHDDADSFGSFDSKKLKQEEAALEKQRKALESLTDYTSNERLSSPAVAPLKVVESFGQRAAKAMTIFRSETGGAFKGIQQLFYGINTPVGLFGKALDGVNQQVFNLNNGFEQAEGVVKPFIDALEKSASTADNVFSRLTHSVAELNKSRRNAGLDEIQVTGVQRATTDIARELGNLVTNYQTSGEISRSVLHNLTREIELARTNLEELKRTTTDSNGNLLPGVQESADQLDILERALQDTIIAEGKQADQTKKAAAAEEKHASALKALLTLLSVFGHGLVSVAAKVGSLASISFDVLKPLKALGGVLRDIGTIALGTFGGNLLTRAFESLSDTSRESSVETLQAMDLFRAQLRGQMAGLEQDTVKMLERQGTATDVAMQTAQASTQRTIEGVFAFIRNVTATTPFQLSDTIDAFNRLLTAKLDPTKWITPIANAASALNVPLEQIVGAFQALTAGDTGEAIARLRDANVAVYDLGLKFNKDGSLGSSVDETLDLLYKFFTTSPAFANASAASVDTLSGAFSNLQDVLGTTGSGFLEPISNELRKVVLSMTDTFGGDGVADKAVDFGTKIASAFESAAVTAGKLTAALDPLWRSIGLVGGGLGSIASGVGVYVDKLTAGLDKTTVASTKLAKSESELEQYKEMINAIFQQMSEGQIDEATKKLAELGLTLDDLGLKVGPDGQLVGDFEKAIEVISNTPGALKVLNDVVNDTIDNMSLLEKVAFSLKLIFEGLGEIISGNFKQGLEDVKYGVAALGFVLGSAFLDFGKNAYHWGGNVITAFAKGFMDVGTKVVNTAIQAVTDIFAWFLEGFSPPKGEPLNKVDTWGENLAKTFTEGFAEADVGQNIQQFGQQLSDKLGSLDIDGMQLFETIQGSLQSQLDLIVSQLDISESDKVGYQQRLSDAILNGIGAYNSGADIGSVANQIVGNGFAGLNGLTDGITDLIANYFRDLEKSAQITSLDDTIGKIEEERDTALDSLQTQYDDLEETLNQNLQGYEKQAENLNEMLDSQKEALDAYNEETDRLVEQAIAAKGLLVSEAEENRAKSKLEDAQKEVKDAEDRLDAIQKRNKDQGITFATFEEINAKAALDLAQQREKEAQAEVDAIDKRKEQAKELESSIKMDRQAGADAIKNQIDSIQERLKAVKDQEDSQKKQNQDLLDAKKLEIAQQKKTYDLRLDAAKQLLDAAKEEQKAIQEQIKLREQALKLQLDAQQQAIDAVKSDSKAAGSKKAGAGKDAARVARQFDAPSFLQGVFGGAQKKDFSKEIDKAFGDVEQQFKNKFDGVVKSARGGFKAGVKNIIADIVDSFKNGGVLGKLKAVLEPFALAIGTALTFIIGSRVIQAFETLKDAIVGVAQAATGLNYTRFIIIALILAVAGILRLSGDPKFDSFFKVFVEFAKTLKDYANAVFEQFVKIYKSFALEADGSLNVFKLLSSAVGAFATAMGILIKLKGWDTVAGFFTRLIGLSAGFNPLIGLFTGMIVHLITMRDQFIEVIDAVGDFIVALQPAFESIGMFATAGGGLTAAIYGLINALVLGGLVALLRLLPVLLQPVIEGMSIAAELFSAFASVLRGDLKEAEAAMSRFGEKFKEATPFVEGLSLAIAALAGGKGLMLLFGSFKSVGGMIAKVFGTTGAADGATAASGVLGWVKKAGASFVGFGKLIKVNFAENLASAGGAAVGIIPKIKAMALAIYTAAGPMAITLAAAVALGAAILALTVKFDKDLPSKMIAGLKQFAFWADRGKEYFQSIFGAPVEDRATSYLRTFGEEIDAVNQKNQKVKDGIAALQSVAENTDLNFALPSDDLKPFLAIQDELNAKIERRKRIIAEMLDVTEGSQQWENLRNEANQLSEEIGTLTPQYVEQAEKLQALSFKLKETQQAAYAMNLTYEDYVRKFHPPFEKSIKGSIPFIGEFNTLIEKTRKGLYEQGKAAYESANSVSRLKQIFRDDRDSLAKFLEESQKQDEEYQQQQEDALTVHNQNLWMIDEHLRTATNQADTDYWNNQKVEENKAFAEQEADRQKNRDVELAERKKHFAELLIQLITAETERKIAQAEGNETLIQQLRDDLADQTSAIAIANGIMTEDSVASANRIIAEYARWTSAGGKDINSFIKILKDMGYDVDEVTLKAIGLGNLSITPEVETTPFDEAMTKLKNLEQLLGTLDEMRVSPKVIVDTINNATGAGKTPDSRKPKTGPLPMLAQGTNFAPGGWALVGENGAELVYLPRGSKVFPKQTTQDFLSSPERFSAITKRFGRKQSDRGIIDVGGSIRTLEQRFQVGMSALGQQYKVLKDKEKVLDFVSKAKQNFLGRDPMRYALDMVGAGGDHHTMPYGNFRLLDNPIGRAGAQPTYSRSVIQSGKIGSGIHIGEIVNQLPANAAQSPERYATAVANKTGETLQRTIKRESNTI